MHVGDLVQWKANLPFVCNGDYGVVIQIIDEYLVGVLWSNSHFVYMEAVEHLEIINEKKHEVNKERKSSEKQIRSGS